MEFLCHGILLKEGIQENVFASQKQPRFFETGRWSLDSSRSAVDSQVPLVGRGGFGRNWGLGGWVRHNCGTIPPRNLT